ncbi:MAG: TlpA family protein disulfide reductase [Saprospiraceae bacterium]|uniref:TlpA family protein disulfide reductase n=1 Tax=Candidatus Opimibacter skivensis TaxID=2982028 RepID=A0A9D7SSK1_9BACT|nr:TlpA family protein disulfide reductase [Candidatus Opimibacter skivensis]
MTLLLHYPFVTATGDTMSIASLKNGYLVLDFWYASCEPCLRALPVANQLAEDYADKELQLIGINCFNKDIRENVVKRLLDKNITIPLFFGSKDLTDALHINGSPSYILITPNRHINFIEGGIDEVKKVIEEIYHK